MNLFLAISVLLLAAAVIGTPFFKNNPKTHAFLLLAFLMLTLCAAVGKIFFLLVGDGMEFERPYMFFLLFFPFAVWVAHAVFKEQFVRRINYPLTHLKTENFSLRVLFSLLLPNFLYILSLCLLVIALARPMRVDRTILPPTEGIDIILLMDVSGSMQKQDFYPNRFAAAQATAHRFVDKRLTDRIGLVAFSKHAMLQVPLTLDHDALQEYINSMYLGMIDPDYTAIGDALGVAANHLKDSKAKSKVIILLTDGDSNAGAIDPLLAAKAAAAYNIRVYTVATARPPKSGASSADDEINEGLLMEIAKRTGGQFYRAKNEKELNQIYDTINQLETTAFAPSSSVNKKDVYAPLLWMALGGFLMAFILEKLIFIKVP